ncbi:DNA-binding response regulator, OmpR family, contains REC and winged-helix (wHTH) domain [Actinacidiphila rubida]|uniref:DNA-binding response regulator, OmpR family, contains REC and winged-helix (WHTH) domain n=3 Tax=Actinacidiphila rubida TaxID=310780 RepID=A0A1H8PV51_9ACTN|nr:response regulator transcription factor [Actinacidiphila rubida]SEO45882.1 DNA-binding response regulator, OmpR family, contains REC and winged-helix (wHTH) domain [Actinacidiphila rubida]
MPAHSPYGPAVTSVLVIEDDEVIGRHLHTGLRGNGYAANWSRTGANGLAEAAHRRHDAVLLDLGLPDIDGMDVARQLRADHPDLLIVILTARSDEIDVIAGLDAGADDYLVKPFSLSVLLARLRAHLRRRPADAHTTRRPIQVGDLTVDPAARRCLAAGREVALRPKEFELLAALAGQPGIAVSREELMAQVWDANWFGPTKTLDVTMAALRRRLEAAETNPEQPRLPHIATLRGHGYRLEPPPD